MNRSGESADAGLLRHVEDLFARSIAVKSELARHHAATIVAIAKRLASALLAGRKILLCGNGGSAADAQHLAAELLVRLRPHTNRRPLAALCLATDTSSLTACGNDLGFEYYFARMLNALGREGDVLIVISTTGRSPNIVRALEAAREMKIVTVGLLGGNGGPALRLCDSALVVPSEETGRVQEAHITAGHALLEIVEDLWLDATRIGTSA